MLDGHVVELIVAAMFDELDGCSRPVALIQVMFLLCMLNLHGLGLKSHGDKQLDAS